MAVRTRGRACRRRRERCAAAGEARTEVEEMKSQISNGFDKVTQNLTDYKNEVKDERIAKLTKIIEDKDTDSKTTKNRKALFVQAFVMLLISSVVAIVVKANGLT